MIIILNIIIKLINFLLVICSITIIVRDWRYNDKRTRLHHKITRGIIFIWACAGFSSAFIVPIINNKIRLLATNREKPKMNVSFYEELNEVIVTFESIAQNQTIIKDVFFKFDIPGKILKTCISRREKVKDVTTLKCFLAAMENDTTAETFHVYANTIFPGGFFRINISFIPTDSIVIPGSENTSFKKKYLPVMDLHDFSRLIITWDFNSISQTEIDYIDLRCLNWTIKDNNNVLASWRLKDMINMIPPKLNKILDSLQNKYSDKWLEEMELSRRDW